MGLAPLQKRAPLPQWPQRDNEKKAMYEPGIGASPDIKSVGATSKPPELQEIDFCCL